LSALFIIIAIYTLPRTARQCEDGCKTVQDVDVTDIKLLAGALRVGGAHLSHNPDTLAFDLVGRLLYYYDDEDDDDDYAAAELARRGSDASTTGTEAGVRAASGLKSLLQQCDAQSTQHSALLPILPCFDPPTAMSVFILEGHSQVVYLSLIVITAVY